MKNDKAYLKHILEAIHDIENFLESISNYEQFCLRENKMMRDAIIRKLEIIGEAAKNLSDDTTKNKESSLPWKDILVF